MIPDQNVEDLEWLRIGEDCGWRLPPSASRWKRLPVVRFFRAVVAAWRVARHNELCAAMGMLPTGYDEWVVYAISRGWC